MKKVIRLTESELIRLVKRVILEQGDGKPLISEQSTKLNDIYKKYFQYYYKDGTNELKMPEGTNGSLYNTYEKYPNEFWNSFDEYFNDTPPTKVYIGNKEIIRPKKF